MTLKNLMNSFTFYLKSTIIIFRDNYSKPTYGMTRFHFAYPWFKTLYFVHLNFNSLPICYPPLLKSGVKMYFIFIFMSISFKNKKITEKTQKNKIKEGGFVAWVQDHTSSWYE